MNVVLLKWFHDKFLNLGFLIVVSAATERGLGNLLCSMEKEDLKILNKGGEEEMVYYFGLLLHHLNFFFPVFRINLLICLCLTRSYRGTICAVGGLCS